MVSDKPLVPSSHGGENVVLQDLTPIFVCDICVTPIFATKSKQN